MEEQTEFLNTREETIQHAPFLIKMYQKFYSVKTRIYALKSKAISASVENTVLSQNVTMTQ